MNTLTSNRGLRFVALSITAGLVLSIASTGLAKPPPQMASQPGVKVSKKKADLYDKTADGAKQIAEALKVAKRENRRVLLQFGANWCGWCHKLHDLFKKDRGISRKLMYEYVVVLIDVDSVDGKKHNEATNEKYGSPTKHGLPVLVVLDADGKQLTTQDTGALEKGKEHDPAKVLAFLEKWQPKPASAEEALSAALAKAKSQKKNVFLQFGAPWCGWCHKLDAYLNHEAVEGVFGKAFVVVKIDIDRMTGGKAMDKKFRGPEPGGIPFFAILDPDGKKLADAHGPKGNVGFPVEPHERAHFMKIIRETAPKLTDEQLSLLEHQLTRQDR